VGTVGRIEAVPGAPNVVPGEVRLTLELRDLDAEKVVRLAERIRAAADEIGKRDGTSFAFTPTAEIEPAPTDLEMRGVVRTAAQGLGLTTVDMPSGAGHDAQSMAQIGPAAMLFIPSVDGISHSPKEFSHPVDIVNGANVLLGAVIGADRVLDG
jgi:N-carbamoyl-L-amino-acid hydrolase